MADGFRTRLARFDWVDYPGIRINPSPTKHSKVTAAVKREGQSWKSRQKSTTNPRLYVRKTVCINADVLRGRDIPREYETWSSLGSHPYVLACEDFQCVASSQALDEATFWSEYCEMGDFGQFIDFKGSRHRSLSLAQAQQIVYQVSSALAFIHYGLYVTLDSSGNVEELELSDHPTLMHRDIKPQNIFIQSFGTGHLYGDEKIHVKLGDFGCAKQLDDDTSMSNTGTVRYKAPESRCTSSSGQFQRPTASVKSDIWSFGATMRDVRDDMSDFYDQCCVDDPRQRPSSVQLLENLQKGMKREHGASTFVLEALKKDTDSTFWDWDYLLLEKLLEVGANPNPVESGALAAIRSIASQLDKSVEDAETVYQLLLKHGASPDHDSLVSSVRSTHIFSYGSVSSTNSAFSRDNKETDMSQYSLGQSTSAHNLAEDSFSPSSSDQVSIPSDELSIRHAHHQGFADLDVSSGDRYDKTQEQMLTYSTISGGEHIIFTSAEPAPSFSQPPYIAWDEHAYLPLGLYHPSRDRTPTDSLINHTGLSPIPLTSTPPHRSPALRPSKFSLAQLPDHTLCDDGNLSDSPTSLKTPDGESLEVDEPSVTAPSGNPLGHQCSTGHVMFDPMKVERALEQAIASHVRYVKSHANYATYPEVYGGHARAEGVQPDSLGADEISGAAHRKTAGATFDPIAPNDVS